jgi:hypothetical protein
MFMIKKNAQESFGGKHVGQRMFTKTIVVEGSTVQQFQVVLTTIKAIISCCTDLYINTYYYYYYYYYYCDLLGFFLRIRN